MVSSVASWFKKQSGHLPLRVVLIVPFVAQTVLAVGITGWLALRNGETAVGEVAMRYRHEITSRIQQKLETSLEVPHRINQANANAVRLRLVDFNDPNSLESYFWQQLYRYSEVNLIYAGNTRGGVVGVARLDEGDYRSFETENFEAGMFSLYKTMRHGRLDVRMGQSENYDARDRPWYKAAVAKGGPAWSDIFLYTNENILGIAATKPIYDDTGTLQGVLSSDFVLDQLSVFLRQLEIGYSGKTFVIERSGYLVATSTQDDPFYVVAPGEQQQRRHVLNSEDPLVRGAAQQLLEISPDLRIDQNHDTTIPIEGDRHFLRVVPFRDGRGLDWLIVVVIPEADFLAQIHDNTRNTILMCVAALSVALISGILTARWVTRPILKLSKASQAIAEGSLNYSDSPHADSHPIVDIDRQDELGLLAQSFNRMATQVRQSFDALSLRTHELEERVSERTAHLVEANRQLQIEIEERKRVEQQLRTSEQRYRTLHEGSQDAVNLFDGEAFIDCNTASLKMFGCATKDQFCGKTPADFSPPQQPDGRPSLPLIQERNAIARQEGTHNFEWVHQRLDGTPFLADVWLSAVEIDGRPMLQAVIRDITERRQAEDARLENARLASLGADIGVALTQGRSLTDMLDRCARALVHTLDVTAARIWTVNEAESTLDLKARAGAYSHLDVFQQHVLIGQSRIGWIAQQRKSYFTDSIVSDLRINDQQWQVAIEDDPSHASDQPSPGAIAFAGYPLVVEDQLVGVLALLSRQPLTHTTRLELFSIANEIALGIQHKRVEAALRQSEARYRSIVENTSDLIVILSLDGKFSYASPNYRQVLGYDSEDLIGQPWAALTHPDEVESLSQFAEQLLQSQNSLSSPEFRIRTKSGQWRWYTAAASCVRDAEGNPLYLVSIARDISDRIQTEETLRQAKTAAEVANRAKSEFLANMSHELRTPLNGILGYAQTLERSELSARQREGLQVIRQCGEHLLALINDVLDLSKIEAHKMELHPAIFDLSALLSDLVNLFRLRARQKQIQFHYSLQTPLPKAVWGDEQKLRQVLINLLGNAIKFTEQGSVTLRVVAQPQIDGGDRLPLSLTSEARLDAKENSNGDADHDRANDIEHVEHLDAGQIQAGDPSLHHICFEVEDTGIGIEAAVLHEIFQPFQQIGHKEGTGLGLSISKQLLELMGSSLQVNSTPHVGSRFWFELDLLEVEPATTPVEGDRPSSTIIGYQGPRRSVLIVDDNAQNCAFLREMLSSIGFEIFTASSGSEGITQAIQHLPDLVLMDVIMPGMSGLEATQQLRNHESASVRKLIVVATSASISDQHQQSSLDAGCQGFLSKPIQIDELLLQIQRFLQLDWIEARDEQQSRPEPHLTYQAHQANESSESHTPDDSSQSATTRYFQRHFRNPSSPPAAADVLRPTTADAAISCFNQWVHADNTQFVGPLPSPDECATLSNLARIGDIQEIMTRLQQLEEADSSLKPFVDRLRPLAKTFQVRKIRKFLESLPTHP